MTRSAMLNITSCRKIIWALALLGAVLSAAVTARAAECRAIVVCGSPGPEKRMTDVFNDWTARWGATLKDVYHFKPENVVVINDPTPAAASATRPASAAAATLPSATHDKIIAALAELVRQSKPEDQAVLVIIGHGYDNQGQSKLALPGKHLSDVEVGRALQPLLAKNLVVINTASSSAAWAKTLAGKGRVIIVADNDTSMRGQTYFCEFMLRALRPGNVNLCDAFNTAAQTTVKWYQNQFIIGDVTTVHGSEFQSIWMQMYPGREMKAGDTVPREPVNDKNNHEAWDGRRVVTETAGLEDNGDGSPSGIFDDGQIFTPLPIKDGDGALAHTIILGKP